MSFCFDFLYSFVFFFGADWTFNHWWINERIEGRWKNAINTVNPLGSKGRLTYGFAKLLHEMWGGDLPYLSPQDFRVRVHLIVSFPSY